MVCAGCSDDMPSPSTAAPTLVPCGATTTYQYAAHDDVDPKLTSVDIYMPSANEDVVERTAARGPDMRLDLHVEFVEALRAADVSTTVLDARVLDNAEVSVNIAAEDDTVVTPALMQFLAGCFTTT
jgi:hypothetical protein